MRNTEAEAGLDESLDMETTPLKWTNRIGLRNEESGTSSKVEVKHFFKEAP
jgi:hypothetical protein